MSYVNSFLLSMLQKTICVMSLYDEIKIFDIQCFTQSYQYVYLRRKWQRKCTTKHGNIWFINNKKDNTTQQFPNLHISCYNLQVIVRDEILQLSKLQSRVILQVFNTQVQRLDVVHRRGTNCQTNIPSFSQQGKSWRSLNEDVFETFQVLSLHD